MSEIKTKPTVASVDDYVAGIEDDKKRADTQALVAIIHQITGEQPVLWGTSIIGFGTYHYKYASGREGDWMRIGLSARKQALTIYGVIFYDLIHENDKLLEKLGPYKKGKGCLYIKSLSDIDIEVLKQMIKNAYSTKY